ncbi:MAG: hypothetical protein M5U26_06955 [Planctomycetota bacterium]|nr:hypothetical protein [Planctomycetota bacterium]
MNTRTNPWFENALLAAILALLGWYWYTSPAPRAQAAGGGWETNNIMALTTDPNERLVLVDTRKKNICIYKNLGAGQFRLVGARSYKYDVAVKDSANTPIEKGNGVTFLDVKRMLDATQPQP